MTASKGNGDWGLGSIPNPQSPFFFFNKLFTEWGQRNPQNLSVTV